MTSRAGALAAGYTGDSAPALFLGWGCGVVCDSAVVRPARARTGK